MKTMKKIVLLVVEFVFILYLGIIFIGVLTGGFSIPFGPLILKVHKLRNPIIILLGTLFLRKIIAGSFFKDLSWLNILQRIGSNGHIRADRLLLILVVLFLIMGAITLTNPLQRGLTGYYYDNEEWAGSPMIADRDYYFNLDRINRILPVITTNFSIKWTGVIFIPETGSYGFATVSKDGSELYIDDQLVVDNRGEHDFRKQDGVIFLEKGFYPINIRYHFLEGPGGPGFKAYWMPPGQKRHILSYRILFLTKPTKVAFLVGQWLEIILGVCKALCLFWGVCIVFIGFKKFASLPPIVKHIIVLTSIFLVVLLSHFLWSRIYTPFDTEWNIYTSMSIINEGNTDLDEYRGLISENDLRIDRIGGHLYSRYPIGTPVLTLPYILLLDKFSKEVLEIDMIKIIKGRPESFIAAAIVAFSSVLIYLIVGLALDDLKYSMLLVFIFAFCTSAWSTASRATWQHGPSMLLLSIALYLLLLAKSKPKYEPWLIRFTSIALAFSYVVRPTNSIPILLFTIFIFIRHRKHFWSYCLWSMIVAVPFVMFNLTTYHALLHPYYASSGQLRVSSFEALAGTLFSPSRGLFIFTPVLLFSIYGIVLKIRHKQMDMLDYFLLMIIVLHWIVSSSHLFWWGGHSYGPRYFTDILPYFIYFMIPTLKKMPTLRGIKRVGFIVAFCCSIAISFFIHYRGATSWDAYLWNVGPVPVEDKLWDWHDLQFLAGLF